MAQQAKMQVTSLPDTFLLVLARRATRLEMQLEQLNSDSRDADDIPGYAAAENDLSVILKSFATEPAETLSGLRAKAGRVLRYRDWDQHPAHDPDVAIAISICRDLIALKSS